MSLEQKNAILWKSYEKLLSKLKIKPQGSHIFLVYRNLQEN